MKKSAYEIDNGNGRKEQVEGYLIGDSGLAVRRLPGRYVWHVDHCPTGLRVAVFNRRAKAFLAAERLSVLTDWKQPKGALQTRELFEAVKKIKQEVENA